MSAATTPMLSVYDGQQCCGFIIRRGHGEFEGFDREEKSLGFFRSESAAANAVIDATRKALDDRPREDQQVHE